MDKATFIPLSIVALIVIFAGISISQRTYTQTEGTVIEKFNTDGGLLSGYTKCIILANEKRYVYDFCESFMVNDKVIIELINNGWRVNWAKLK